METGQTGQSDHGKPLLHTNMKTTRRAGSLPLYLAVEVTCLKLEKYRRTAAKLRINMLINSTGHQESAKPGLMV